MPLVGLFYQAIGQFCSIGGAGNLKLRGTERYRCCLCNNDI